MTPPYRVRAMRKDDAAALLEHFIRHKAESGRDGIHFMPYLPNSDDGPSGANPDALSAAIGDPGWQRWFVVEAEGGRIVGHLDLQGDRLRTANHRCTLGIGLETAYRGTGIGRELIQLALDFARAHPPLAWIDLWVFGSNLAAIALYRRMGFLTIGSTPDQFRFGDQSVDDIHMVLKL